MGATTVYFVWKRSDGYIGSSTSMPQDFTSGRTRTTFDKIGEFTEWKDASDCIIEARQKYNQEDGKVTSMKPDITPLPSLARTSAAIEAYDMFDASLNFDGMTQEQVQAGFAELERLGQAVGEAFGLDTADRNSVNTCREVIRPGHKIPGPGCELSYVRRMVNKWRDTK